MPIYEYACKKCNKSFEEVVFNTEELPPCPYCNSTETFKLISTCRHCSSGSDGFSSASSSSSGGGCAGCSGGSCSTCH